MKLNQELLNRIQDKVANEFGYLNWYEAYEDGIRSLEIIVDEVCRRYSEQIIKCTECDGSGEHEINVDGMDAPSADGCQFCGGKGYLEE